MYTERAPTFHSRSASPIRTLLVSQVCCLTTQYASLILTIHPCMPGYPRLQRCPAISPNEQRSESQSSSSRPPTARPSLGLQQSRRDPTGRLRVVVVERSTLPALVVPFRHLPKAQPQHPSLSLEPLSPGGHYFVNVRCGTPAPHDATAEKTARADKTLAPSLSMNRLGLRMLMSWLSCGSCVIQQHLRRVLPCAA